jgi:ABC-type lipoprotein export system ATPase subunit
VFQNQYLLPQLTAVQNVALPFLATDTAIRDAEKKAKEQLSEFGLEDRLDFRVAEMSGGEQQRVSIARGLMNNPSVLIADEPSSSMEQDLVEYLLDLLRTMCDDQGLTVIVASHDPRVLEWGDEVYRLSRGVLVDEQRS